MPLFFFQRIPWDNGEPPPTGHRLTISCRRLADNRRRLGVNRQQLADNRQRLAVNRGREILEWRNVAQRQENWHQF